MRLRPSPWSSLRRRCSRTAIPCLLLFLLAYGGIFALVLVAYAKLAAAPNLRNLLAGEIVDFSGADNETGFPEPIVPNVVHFIKFGGARLSFVEMLCMRAALVNQRPDRLMVHCSECPNGTLEGRYWDMLQDPAAWPQPPPPPRDLAAASPAPWPPVQVAPFRQPTHIFGKRLSSVYHASDVARILVLMRHGGIFLDSDSYVVQSLDRFRHFEFAVGWPRDAFIGTQVLVAHRNARFLKLWLNSYRWYLPNRWYYNAGQLPSEGILEKQPHLAHRVPQRFGVHELVDELYKRDWPGWRDYYAVHLLARHRSYLDKDSPVKEFDEHNVKTYNFTFGRMARKVLYGTEDFVR